MRERIHAPERSGAAAWLNTADSARFDAEKDAARILAALRRYGVSHPVAVDSEQRIWSQYAVRFWPALVIIRPDGTLAAVAPGEPDPVVLEGFVQQLLAESRAAGTLVEKPAPVERPAPEIQQPLNDPGKIAQGGGKIFVSDSGHHRVLVLDAKGSVIDCIGSGLRGMREGGFQRCALDDPQGLAFQNGMLDLADARAHVVFRADMAERTLSRLAGTGALGKSASMAQPSGLALQGDGSTSPTAGRAASASSACARASSIRWRAGRSSSTSATRPAPSGPACCSTRWRWRRTPTTTAFCTCPPTGRARGSFR